MKQNRRSLPALALALVLALVLAVPFFGGIAGAVDLNAACSLTVESGGVDLEEDLADTGVVLDLYQVAEARAVPGSDSYSYELLPDFSGLAIDGDMNNAAWMEVAQKAAETALSEETVLPRIEGTPAGEQITGLDAGLYLIIARGAGMEEYQTTVRGDDGTEKLATKAESERYCYTFLPEMVSLPTKEPDADGEISTATPGDWIYEAEITLKPEQSPRTGSLEIVKGLEGFVSGQIATFVFDVEAVLDGEVVYSNVFSMNFGEAGTKRLQVDGIPVGSTVTVTEVYSGATYQLVSDSSQTAVIQAGEMASVSFVNTPTDNQKRGGSVTNRFAYVDGNWQWQEIPDIP